MDSLRRRWSEERAVEEAAEVCQKVIKIREKDMPKLIKDVERLCSSDQLALAPLKEKIKIISTLSSPYSSPMLHSRMLFNACGNKNITVEIMECILEVCDVNRSYFNSELNTTLKPICMACTNNDCPTSVIELLIEKGRSALDHLSLLGNFGSIEGVQGLPLHFYLMMREASCIDVEVIKKLVDAYPEALSALLPAENNGFVTTLGALLQREEVDDLVDIFRVLVELNPSAVQLRDSVGFTPIHRAVCLDGINSWWINQALVKVWPEGLHESDNDGNLPIHILCSIEYDNENAIFDTAMLLIEEHPDSLRQNNLHGDTPLHLAAAYSSPYICQLLVSYESELVSLLTRSGKLPIHKASYKGSIDRDISLSCTQSVSMSEIMEADSLST